MSSSNYDEGVCMCGMPECYQNGNASLPSSAEPDPSIDTANLDPSDTDTSNSDTSNSDPSDTDTSNLDTSNQDSFDPVMTHDFNPSSIDNYANYSMEHDVFLQTMISRYNKTMCEFNQYKSMNFSHEARRIEVTMEEAYCNGTIVDFSNVFPTWLKFYDMCDRIRILKFRLEQIQRHIDQYIRTMKRFMPNNSDLNTIRLDSIPCKIRYL
jgi:type II secretory pathway pseudopilin PulG